MIKKVLICLFSTIQDAQKREFDTSLSPLGRAAGGLGRGIYKTPGALSLPYQDPAQLSPLPQAPLYSLNTSTWGLQSKK